MASHANFTENLRVYSSKSVHLSMYVHRGIMHRPAWGCWSSVHLWTVCDQM